jgi:hypothetical protein
VGLVACLASFKLGCGEKHTRDLAIIFIEKMHDIRMYGSYKTVWMPLKNFIAKKTIFDNKKRRDNLKCCTKIYLKI